MDPRLDTLVRDGMERYRVPGIAVGIWNDGKEELGGWGKTNIDHPLDVTPDTLFQIASITKTITATVVMRLVEQGKIELGAPVRTYIPEFRLKDEHAASRATVKHLLTHTGGWLGDSFRDFGGGSDALAKYVEAMVELEQLTPLGEIWHYSNSSFTVLGRLIEIVTGKSYEDATRELL
ncbi:MAG TPA: serine hydrolase domain-containing protein, partial [Candidatus Limnocylindrales bacterium]|nr:serine hydrolase domain-containing protein [Candidatus Limnocylindrales bacterium]